MSTDLATRGDIGAFSNPLSILLRYFLTVLDGACRLLGASSMRPATRRRVFLRSFLFAVSVIQIPSNTAQACGGFFCNRPDNPFDPPPVVQTAENVLFAVNPSPGPGAKRLEAHIQIFYSGPAAAFSWIWPVDAEPTLDVGSDAVFTTLDNLRDRASRSPTTTKASASRCRAGNAVTSLSHVRRSPGCRGTGAVDGRRRRCLVPRRRGTLRRGRHSFHGPRGAEGMAAHQQATSSRIRPAASSTCTCRKGSTSSRSSC